MCNYRKHPEEYFWASGYLRGKGINAELPGYEYLKIGIVEAIIERPVEINTVIRAIEKQASVVIGHGLVTPKYSAVKQAVIEAIKSVEKCNINESSHTRTAERKRKDIDEMIMKFLTEAAEDYDNPKKQIRRSIYLG